MEFLILFIPIVWLLISRYLLRNTITIAEMLLGIVLVTGAAGTLYYLTLNAMKLDYELWNGQIEKKEKRKVSCSHSYECNCRSSSTGGTSSCSTCYEHDYDWSWILHTSAGRIYINRIDSRGLETPPNWEKAYVSEPVSLVKEYTNYIKAVPSALYDNPEFKTDQAYDGFLPQYPLDLQTEYSFQHVRAYGVEVDDLPEWNRLMAETLKVIGPEKQVNVIVLIVNARADSYMASLETRWLKGKKNDVIVVIGSSQYPEMDWVEVMSWSPSRAFKEGLKEAVMRVDKLTAKGIVPVIETHIRASYERMQMADYNYLEDEISVPQDIFWWLLGILTIGPMLFTLLAYKYDTTVMIWPFVSFGSLFPVAAAMNYFGVFITLGSVVLMVAGSSFIVTRLRERKKKQDKASKRPG
ncbi:MAG TPA: hypothetical protein ENJ08_02705 [Gammaproteobacteria bacterium]|nr:hypothetical protein [Gammaproteobacteria bacterium]